MDNEVEGKTCPIMSAGMDTIETCHQAKCAWWVVEREWLKGDDGMSAWQIVGGACAICRLDDIVSS